MLSCCFFLGSFLIFSIYNYYKTIFFFIFLQVNSQRRTQWVFECSRAFIFGWRSGTDRNQSLETVASEKHYLIHRWVLFLIFCAEIEKIRNRGTEWVIECLQVFILGEGSGPDLNKTKVQIKSEWMYEIINFPNYQLKN